MYNLFEMLVSNSVVCAVLALVVFGISRQIRRPALLHCLWVIVLLKLVTPPIIPLRISAPALVGIGRIADVKAATDTAPRVEPTAYDFGLQESQERTANSTQLEYLDRDGRMADTGADVSAVREGIPSALPAEATWAWPRATTVVAVAMYVWLASCLVVLGLTIVRGGSFWRLLRAAKPASNELQSETERLAASIGLRRCPRVLVLTANLSPMVWAAFGRPQLLFPEELLRSLRADARRALLLHELSHLKRRDHWVRLLELAATTLYWWYPVLWWVRRELRVVEEQCCDSWVVAELPNGRADYATGLVQTVGFLSHGKVALPVGASGIGGFVELDRRVRMIMTETHSRRVSPLVRWALLLLGLACLSAFPVIGNRTLPAEESVANEANRSAERAATAGSLATVRRSAPEAGVRMHGRVVGPGGEAFGSAKIWLAGPPRRPQSWSRSPQSVEWRELARSGQNGAFEVALDESFSDAMARDPLLTVRVAASARGLGWAWADVRATDLSNEIALQLTEDVPINGRLLTLDGKPAAGVTVTVNHMNPMTIPVSEIKKVAPGSRAVYMNTPAWNGGGPTFKPVVTDAEGRFYIEGMGAKRRVRLQTVGGEIGATRLNITTHPPPESFQPSGAIAIREGISESSYFANFTHLGAPSRTLRGQVTDVETGDPVPGVQISSLASWHTWTHPALTDEDGRFEIKGVLKSADYRLEFVTTKTAHFNKGVVVVDSGGLQPLEVNVALAKGILVTGRVTDTKSGAPVTGTVSYEPLYGNENVLTNIELSYAETASTQIDEDGSYSLSVLPGPGAIAVKTESQEYLSARVDAERLKEVVGEQNVQSDQHGDVNFIQTSAGPQIGGAISARAKNAIALVNPTEVEPFEVDFQLVRGKSRQATIVDDNEEPLVGAEVTGHGISAALASDRTLVTASFTVNKLAQDRERSLLVVHRERELGARVVVSGGDLTPLTIRLQRTGRIRGRFVDKLGEPIQGGQVELISQDLRISGVGWAEVGDDGQFEVSGLIEGASYRLQARPRGSRFPMYVAGDITVSSGEIEDLGTFTRKNEYQFRRVDAGTIAEPSK